MNHISHRSVVELVTLPDGKLSAWGGRRVYRREWTAYVVEKSDGRGLGTFFRVNGADWKVIATYRFKNKKNLTQWVKDNKSVDVEAQTAR